MRYSDELPCSIEDVVHLLGITVVRDSGTRLTCKCPFCNDRSGHLDVKPEANVFHCYRCGKGGGVLHLYAEYHDVSLRTAASELKQIFQSDEGLALRAGKPERREISHEETPIADAAVRHHTYSCLFSLLTLGKTHQEALRARGMSEADILWSGYRTTPAVRLKRLVSQLVERGCTLTGVPGFYCDKESGEWKLDIRGHGIMLPDRSAKGEIEAVQIRLDHVWKGHKFNNLTSTDQHCGTAANCCPHFVGVEPGARSVIVTEGVMKADLAHRFSIALGHPSGVVGLTGAGMKNQYRRALRELNAFGVKRILLAYDADFRTNEAVAQNREFALEEGSEMGYEMVPLEWDPAYKGIDDLFLSFIRKQSR